MDRADLAARLGVRLSAGKPQDAVVCETAPETFQRAFAEAVAAGGRVFLADPNWSVAERADFDQLRHQAAVPEMVEAKALGWLCIPTGGSTGKLKLARHDAASIAEAVQGFCAHFDCTRVNAYGVLPLHHVSGLMAWLRTLITGGQYTPASWREIEAGKRPVLGEDGAFLSLVPTQLQRLLADPAACDWMRSFAAVFVGGGPMWSTLLEAAAAARLPLALSYGMTETAAMVAALLPSEFAAGQRSSGRILPHAKVTVNLAGALTIQSESLFRGYYPALPEKKASFDPNDRGRIDAEGFLWIEGRSDQLIITGGEKVDPLAVEDILRSLGVFADVAVMGLPDPEWGQVVVAAYPGDQTAPDWERVQAQVKKALSAFKRPKHFYAVSPWPRNAQGKLNRAQLAADLLQRRRSS